MHVTLKADNPYSASNIDEGKPVKITITGVKLHYDNKHIEDHLKGLGAKLVAPVKHYMIKDSDKTQTRYKVFEW